MGTSKMRWLAQSPHLKGIIQSTQFDFSFTHSFPGTFLFFCCFEATLVCWPNAFHLEDKAPLYFEVHHKKGHTKQFLACSKSNTYREGVHDIYLYEPEVLADNNPFRKKKIAITLKFSIEKQTTGQYEYFFNL